MKDTGVAWLILMVASVLEVVWAAGLKCTDGFTRQWPTVATTSAMILSLLLLGVAMKSLPVGTAYSVWVGVGAVGTVILGIVLFGEPANSGRLLSVALVIAGVIGLKLTSPSRSTATPGRQRRFRTASPKASPATNPARVCAAPYGSEARKRVDLWTDYTSPANLFLLKEFHKKLEILRFQYFPINALHMLR